MIKKIILISGIITAGIINSYGASSSTVLLEDLGAKGSGMSGACSSLSGDVTYLRYNPASIAGLDTAQVSGFYYNSGLTGINYGSVTYGQSFWNGTAAISIAYLNGGEMDLNFIDGTTSTVTSEMDIVGSVSYALKIGKSLSAGATVKVLSSSLIGSLSGIAFAGDIGIRYENLLMEGLNGGLAVLNIGTGMKYLTTSEPLPLNAAAGISYNTSFDKIQVTGAVDAVYAFGEGIKAIIPAIEGRYDEFSARAGMPLNSNSDISFTAGVGYKFDEFTFDYCAGFGKSLGLAHKISIGMNIDDSGSGKKSSPKKENKGSIRRVR